MFADIDHLRAFYATPLGLRTQEILCEQLDALWKNLRGERVLTLGYGAPLLPALAEKTREFYAFMPAAQGVSLCPQEGANIACLVKINSLPLASNSIDRVVLLHALEGAKDPNKVLSEIWRVMKSGGRLLTIVPNRSGLWARKDLTPFGSGQPFSQGQIRKSLNINRFFIDTLHYALYTLPSSAAWNLSLSATLEKYIPPSVPGGIILVESIKQLYAPIPVAPLAEKLRAILPEQRVGQVVPT